MLNKPDFTFNDLLERRDVDIHTSRVVRHDWRAFEAWQHSRNRFEHFISYQRLGPNTPYRGAKSVFHFVPTGSTGGLFVGAHLVVKEWQFTKDARLPALFDKTAPPEYDEADHLRYDLERLGAFDDLEGKVVIEWGSGTRAWSQWPARQPKPILELRARSIEEPFPGFARFASSVDEVALLPEAWRGALSSVQGVYLLVCPETGEQYVGSAYGDGGFMQRWSEYAANGHGGNKLLVNRQKVNYAVSILEVASPDMSSSDIIHREAAWKVKLGSRAHGLNAN